MNCDLKDDEIKKDDQSINNHDNNVVILNEILPKLDQYEKDNAYLLEKL